MKYVDKIPKIKRLADKFGTPLVDAKFVENGIEFTYRIGQVNPTTYSHKYSDADRGIQEEIIRLEQLLRITP